MKKMLLIFFLICFPVLSEGQISEDVFRNPSREYGPMTWWHWINGNVTKEGIRKDLIAMHKNGMRGVQMFNVHIYLPKGPLKYGSDQWIDYVKYAVEICDSLDMKFVAMNSAGWSGSGGPWITPELSMKKLVFSEINIIGGKNIYIQVPKPKIQDNYYQDIAVLAVPAKYEPEKIVDKNKKILMATNVTLEGSKMSPICSAISRSQIIDLTDKFDENQKLKWNAPVGEWTIIRFGYTSAGRKSHPNAWGGEGYECDKLDADVVAFQFDQSLGKLLKATKKYLGNTFEGILFDSYEAGQQNWTSKFPDKFKELNGYDILSWLPLYTGRYIENVDKSERVLYDIRRTLDIMLAENYYGTMQKLANENKLIVYAEGQGGPISPQSVIDYIDIPMNEFWTPDTRPRMTRIKLTASLGNVQNKQIIAAEAYTSTPDNGKWQNTPWRMKKGGDLAFASGVNRYCFHTYVHQPFDHVVPGFTMGRYGTIFSRHLTWWNYAKDWFSYITRSQYLLQQGKTLADVGFLFHNDIRYSFSSDMVALPSGYDYQIIYPESLHGAKVINGDIVLPCGMQFKVLVLAENSKMDLETLKLLSDLVKKGATISGCPPVGIPSEYNWSIKKQSEFDMLINKMWGGLNGKTKYRKEYGNGVIYQKTKAFELIKLMNIEPDVYYGNVDLKDVMYHIHRVSDTEDIYFLTNQTEKKIRLDILFRINKRLPEIWDPITGVVYEPSVNFIDGDKVSIPYEFAPYGSAFFVFRDKSQDKIESKKQNYRNPQLLLKSVIDCGWEIDFIDKRQGITTPIVTNNLFLWNESNDKRIKYYSGTGVYKNVFKIDDDILKKSARIKLDLGPELYNIAEVVINDKSLGTVWTKPYVVDITDVIRSGNNKIEIRVANTWINRIIGDEAIPDNVEYDTKGDIFKKNRAIKLPDWIYGSDQMPKNRKRITYSTWKHYEADSPLVPSGLPGPVTVNFYSK